jgi:O-antigen/teichoic acid export membrane protein
LTVTATAEFPLSGNAALAQAQRAALSVFVIRMAGAALAYGTQVLVARIMGKPEYGVFATAWVWIIVLGHASLWGLGQATCRFIPHYRARGETDRVRGFLAGGFGFTAMSGLVTAMLAAALLWLGRGQIAEPYLWPLAFAVLVVPVLALQDYVEAVARSFNWVGLAIAPPYIVRQSLIGAVLIASITLGAPAQAWVAVACTLAASGLTLLLQAGVLVRRLRGVVSKGLKAYRVKEWASASAPLAIVDLTLTGFNFIDVLLLGFFLPPEAVAIYFAATRILQFVVFVSYAASAATAARFAETKARGDAAHLRALVLRTARLGSIATVVVGAGVLLAAPMLLRVFGPGFEASFNALAILVIGMMAYSAFGPAEDVLNMLGGERVCASVAFTALLIAVLLIVMLVPPLGIVGAAWAMASANVLRGAALAVAAKRRLGISTHVFARGGG